MSHLLSVVRFCYGSLLLLTISQNNSDRRLPVNTTRADSFFSPLVLAVRGADLDVSHKHARWQTQWQIWYFPLDLTLSRNQPCASKPNKHYSVSQKKSMLLSLLCLIGLRRNQIERDNCVPVTFPLRQAERGGWGWGGGASWGSGKDGECVCMWVHVCVCVCVCIWARGSSRGSSMLLLRVARHIRASELDVGCPKSIRWETGPGGMEEERARVCMARYWTSILLSEICP